MDIIFLFRKIMQYSCNTTQVNNQVLDLLTCHSVANSMRMRMHINLARLRAGGASKVSKNLNSSSYITFYLFALSTLPRGRRRKSGIFTIFPVYAIIFRYFPGKSGMVGTYACIYQHNILSNFPRKASLEFQVSPFLRRFVSISDCDTVEPLCSGHHWGTTLAIIEGWPHLRVFCFYIKLSFKNTCTLKQLILIKSCLSG